MSRPYPGLRGGGKPYGDPLTVKFNQQTLHNLSRPEYSRILLAPLAKKSGGYGICEAKSGKPVLTSRDAPEFQSLLRAIQRTKDQLDQIKRFGMLRADHDDSDHVDYYELDQAYWKSHWSPIR